MNEMMRWCYKTVHYQFKKEGILGEIFLDESEMEESLNEYGSAGWELVSLMEIHGGIIAIFKQPMGIPSIPVEVQEKEIIKANEEADDVVPRINKEPSTEQPKKENLSDDDEIGIIPIE